MKLNFEQARELLRSHLSSRGDTSSYIAEWGFENEQWWEVPCGRYELLVECNEEFLEDGPPAWFVNKFTGEVKAGSSAFNPDFFFSEELECMNPFGEVPPLFRQCYISEDEEDF